MEGKIQNMQIRKATEQDLNTIMEIYAHARRFMAQTGNPTQWSDSYPQESLIRQDIESGISYVCTGDGDEIEAVFMYAQMDDPTYRVIEDGAWKNDRPYGVLHRIASRGQVRGAASFCMQWCFDQCRNLKCDTHEDNKVMQHVLEKNGFERCGRIYTEAGSPRIAFQKTGQEACLEQDEIYQLLQQVQQGTRTPEDALRYLKTEPEMRVGDYADIDLHRAVRQGMPEVIYGEGKTTGQIAGIAQAMKSRGIANIMVTRLSPEKAQVLQEQIGLEYEAIPRIGFVNRCEKEKRGKIAVVAAGTSDLPVAEEAAVTAEAYGNYVERVYDVGVAGIHRLLHRLPSLADANVVIAVAGMEGALVSVVGGLVECPVIGVPTSVGYGANFGGLAALLSMLNSCASGVSIVNIDNGFGAGVLASKINKQSISHEE
jgi:hypothetical protein